MPESPLIQKEVAALTDLEAIIAARAKGETETELVFHRRREREEKEFKEASRQLSTQYKTQKAALEAEYQRARQSILQTFERESQAINAEYSQVKQKIDAQARSERSRAKKVNEDARWQAMAMFEAARDSTVKARKRDEALRSAAGTDLETLKEAAEPVLNRCKVLAGPAAGGDLAASGRRPGQARRSRRHRSWRKISGHQAARGHQARR